MSENQKIINVVVNEGPRPPKVGPLFFVSLAILILVFAGSCNLVMAIVEALR